MWPNDIQEAIAPKAPDDPPIKKPNKSINIKVTSYHFTWLVTMFIIVRQRKNASNNGHVKCIYSEMNDADNKVKVTYDLQVLSIFLDFFFLSHVEFI